MPKHKVGTREEWSAARKELLERERELGGRDEELAKQRKELPWVAVEKEYTFDTEQGKKTLAELFDGAVAAPHLSLDIRSDLTARRTLSILTTHSAG